MHDAVAAYRALLDDGIPANDIVLAGESSGGGLTLAATVAIIASGLPRPAAVYVASPWADLTTTGASMTTKAAADPRSPPTGSVVAPATTRTATTWPTVTSAPCSLTSPASRPC